MGAVVPGAGAVEAAVGSAPMRRGVRGQATPLAFAILASSGPKPGLSQSPARSQAAPMGRLSRKHALPPDRASALVAS